MLGSIFIPTRRRVGGFLHIYQVLSPLSWDVNLARLTDFCCADHPDKLYCIWYYFGRSLEARRLPNRSKMNPRATSTSYQFSVQTWRWFLCACPRVGSFQKHLRCLGNAACVTMQCLLWKHTEKLVIRCFLGHMPMTIVIRSYNVCQQCVVNQHVQIWPQTRFRLLYLAVASSVQLYYLFHFRSHRKSYGGSTVSSRHKSQSFPSRHPNIPFEAYAAHTEATTKLNTEKSRCE